MADLVTVEEHRARLEELKARVTQIDSEATGRSLSELGLEEEWNDLNAEIDHEKQVIDELEQRRNRVAELADEAMLETEQRFTPRGRVASRQRVPDDPFDVAGYRTLARSVDELPEAYREGAMRILEKERRIPGVSNEDAQEHVERLMVEDSSPDGEVARRVIQTGSDLYHRAFRKKYQQRELTTEEQGALARAASLTTTAGGYAVPYQLDPTVIPSSSGVLNPVRQIARVQTISVDQWNGVTSDGITAAYSAEAASASDNAPTLGQAAAYVEKAQAWIPFSIEIGEDWSGFQGEIARMLTDAKDVLESAQFLTGLGHSSHVPEGLLVGATRAVTSASTATFAEADLYSLTEALAPRFQARATIVASRTTLNATKQFVTSGGMSLWTEPLASGAPGRLLEYPTRIWSDMSTAVTTTGSSIMTVGDFSNFLILDRVGMNIELVPHVLSSAVPTGQRGYYCYWRSSSKVLTNKAFETLVLL